MDQPNYEGDPQELGNSPPYQNQGTNTKLMYCHSVTLDYLDKIWKYFYHIAFLYIAHVKLSPYIIIEISINVGESMERLNSFTL